MTTTDDILTDLLPRSPGLPSTILTTIRISTFCDLNHLINLQRQDYQDERPVADKIRVWCTRCAGQDRSRSRQTITWPYGLRREIANY